MPKFSIRDVLWLTVVVGLTAGWWVDRWPLIEEKERLERVNMSLFNELCDYESKLSPELRKANRLMSPNLYRPD
jgi:hypothetical protein